MKKHKHIVTKFYPPYEVMSSALAGFWMWKCKCGYYPSDIDRIKNIFTKVMIYK